MRKYIVYNDGYYFMRFNDLPVFGKHTAWTPDIENAKEFESEEKAQSCLEDGRFDDFRKGCEIHII